MGDRILTHKAYEGSMMKTIDNLSRVLSAELITQIIEILWLA